MSKLENTRGFTDQFKSVLSLSATQIEMIDDIEFRHYKDYHWNSTAETSFKKFGLIRRIMSELNEFQITVLKRYRDDQVEKIARRKKEKLNQLFTHQAVRLKSLALSEKQLWQYVEIKSNWSQIFSTKVRSAKKLADTDLSNIKKEINQEFIYPIFDEHQFYEYKQLVQNEERKKEIWQLEHERRMFESTYSLKLTDHQAKILFKKSDIIPAKDEKGYFYSDFERADLKLEKLKLVLDQEQFSEYEPYHIEYINNIEANLVKSNTNHHLNQLNVITEYFEYYIEKVLPEKCESRKRIENILVDSQRLLIEQVRMIYFAKLDASLDLGRSEHLRFNKDLVPNELKAFEMRDRLARVRPNECHLYGLVLAKELMSEELTLLLKEEYDYLRPIFTKQKEVHIDSYEKSGGSYGGWLMKFSPKEGEEHLRYIGLLLIEPELEANLNKLKTR